MEKKCLSLFKFLQELFKKRWTGQLRLNIHKGDLSEKIEKKESIRLTHKPVGIGAEEEEKLN